MTFRFRQNCYFREKEVTLKNLTAKDIQEFYLRELERVSASSVIHYHANIHKALKYAVKIDLIDVNPADKVERPKKDRYVGSFYDADEVNALFEAAKGSKLELPILFGAFYGLRRSEAIGLKWDAIDFDQNTITIRHTVTSCDLDGKAVMKQKGESGEYLTTNPPYGYMKDPENPKRHWIVDDEAAAVVRQIFAWCMEGFGPSQIAKKLKEAKVDCPTVHWMKMGRNAPAKTPDNPYDWAPRTITGILEKQEYLGHMVNFKTRKQSYRSKKKLENPPDQWKIFENTHEAIIDEETFARVQELRKNKRRPARTGKTNMFSGLVRCADCDEKLYYCTSNSFETRQDHFVCSTSRKKGKEVCDTHFIRAVVLEEGTLQHMRLVIQCIADYEDAFRRALGAKRSEEARKELTAKKRTLQKSENRLAELDRLFKRIYEDMVNGKLSEARFQMLADDYEQEQADLRVKIEMLENEIQNQENQAENVDRFIRQAKKYLYLEKLTPTILNDMVNAVYVHAPDKSSGHRVQDVTISYNYIGILPANLLYDVMNGKAA